MRTVSLVVFLLTSWIAAESKAVASSNLVANADFDWNIDGWIGGGPYANWVDIDGDGEPTSG